MNISELIHKRVFIIGNGGSYANAMHVCNDLLSKGIKTFTLDPATLTAFSNDHGYENAFARWISVVGEKGDVLVCFSGSGKSSNILNAISMAEDRGLEVVKVFGPDLTMQRAEEVQLEWGHDLWRQLKN